MEKVPPDDGKHAFKHDGSCIEIACRKTGGSLRGDGGVREKIRTRNRRMTESMLSA